MAEILPGYYAAIAQVVVAACPELLPPGPNTTQHGVFEAEHVELVPWEQLTPPYAVIHIEDMPSTGGNYGPTNWVAEVPVHIYYVSEVRGPVGGIRAALENLRDAFLSGVTCPATLLQVLDVDALTWSSDLVPNAIFVPAGHAHRAGRITVRILMGRPYPAP